MKDNKLHKCGIIPGSSVVWCSCQWNTFVGSLKNLIQDTLCPSKPTHSLHTATNTVPTAVLASSPPRAYLVPASTPPRLSVVRRRRSSRLGLQLVVLLCSSPFFSSPGRLGFPVSTEMAGGVIWQLLRRKLQSYSHSHVGNPWD
ncbi:hypothetical protein PIB30_040688 [Stylosanthes scabra]|uniref:Uncharacterized protein n=1 Tax=Stylosanthes scabra TaxID=79078 RepID=A0ABU6QFA3_9FABA|nr:hypothetical protein [Stylosanthes scabra]